MIMVLVSEKKYLNKITIDKAYAHFFIFPSELLKNDIKDVIYDLYQEQNLEELAEFRAYRVVDVDLFLHDNSDAAAPQRVSDHPPKEYTFLISLSSTSWQWEYLQYLTLNFLFRKQRGDRLPVSDLNSMKNMDMYKLYLLDEYLAVYPNSKDVINFNYPSLNQAGSSVVDVYLDLLEFQYKNPITYFNLISCFPLHKFITKLSYIRQKEKLNFAFIF